MRFLNFLKRAGIVLAIVILWGLAGVAIIYSMFCTGHPHGLC